MEKKLIIVTFAVVSTFLAGSRHQAIVSDHQFQSIATDTNYSKWVFSVCVAESIDCNIMMLQHKKVTVLDKSANEQPQKKLMMIRRFIFSFLFFWHWGEVATNENDRTPQDAMQNDMRERGIRN